MMKHKLAPGQLRIELTRKGGVTDRQVSRTGKPIIHNIAIMSVVADTAWVEQEEA